MAKKQMKDKKDERISVAKLKVGDFMSEARTLNWLILKNVKFKVK